MYERLRRLLVLNRLLLRVSWPLVRSIFIYHNFKMHAHLQLPKYAFIFVSVVTIIRSFIHFVYIDGGAQSIASIPLDSFSKDGSDAVIFIFSQWGLSQLLMGLFYLFVIWRAQKLIPLMWVIILTEYVFRLVIGRVRTLKTEETAPGAVGNIVFVPLSLLMIFLSLSHRSVATSQVFPQNLQKKYGGDDE